MIQEVPAMRAMLVEARAAEFCLDWVLPKSKCCSGCYDFADSVGLDIDNANHDTSMAEKLTARRKGQSHTSKRFKCLQLWKFPLEAIAIKKNKALAQYQKQFIQDVRSRNPTRLEILSPTTPAVPRRLDAALVQQQNDITPDEPEADPNCTPSPVKKARTINYRSYKIGGKEIKVPMTHCVVTASYLSRLQNQDARLQSLKDAFSKKKFVTHAMTLLERIGWCFSQTRITELNTLLLLNY